MLTHAFTIKYTGAHLCAHSAASFTRHILPDKDHKHMPEHKGANILMPLPARKAKLELDLVLLAGKGRIWSFPEHHSLAFCFFCISVSFKSPV